jgi:hypothetical protein
MPEVSAEMLRHWQEIVDQAMGCIRGETPEDCTFGEAEDDTFEKLRAVDAQISAALARKE